MTWRVGILAFAVSGCASPGEHGAPGGGARPAPATATAVSGEGTAIDEAPPQRRFRLVWVGAPGGARLKVVEDSNVMALPPAPGGDAKVPEPPAVEAPPDAKAPPPAIKVPAPH